MRGRTATWLGLACAGGALAIGLVFLVAAGAPTAYPAVQAGAFGIGVAALALLRFVPAPSRRTMEVALLAMGAALLATALAGFAVEGAARWVKIGTLHVQTSLILLPPMILLYARGSGPAAATGMALAALGLVLQPDRAMAGVLAAALCAMALADPRRDRLVAAAIAAFCFVAALAQPDALPAVPFVDGILFTGFEVHPMIGAALVLGAVALPFPALGGGAPLPRLAFGVAWAGIAAAAALGNYPTPLVGYGGSAVLGYLLSVALLGGETGRTGERRAVAGSKDRDPPSGEKLRRATA